MPLCVAVSLGGVSSLDWADVSKTMEKGLSQQGTLTAPKVMREGKDAFPASDLASPYSVLMGRWYQSKYCKIVTQPPSLKAQSLLKLLMF